LKRWRVFERVAVVGAGAAGAAAAWTAAQRGAEVHLFDAAPGASCLAGGAVDDQPWEHIERAAAALDVEPVARPLSLGVERFVAALGLWQVPQTDSALPRLCTEAGRIRLARGRDEALLDAAALPDGARVLVPRVARQEWDADTLARALSADRYARARRIAFEAVDAALLEHVGEDRVAAAELAARHDSAERRAWLSDRLRELCARHGRVDAVLLGPWLGAAEPRAQEISHRAGVRVGEVLSGVGGAAGLRFEAARARMLSAVGVSVLIDRVSAIGRAGDELGLSIAGPRSLTIAADAVVLAVGGLAGGGIVFDPPGRSAGQDIAEHVAPSFRLSLTAAVALQSGGRRLDTGSSMHGPALDRDGWPARAEPGVLETVGIACDGERVLPAAGPTTPPAGRARVFAAGDAVADRPRTLLEAVASGVRAGAAAAGEPGTIR
jgi:glycerol-3-phosphate dehydrogenase subunit B